MPSELFQMTTFCERPVGNTDCGNCSSCMRMKYLDMFDLYDRNVSEQKTISITVLEEASLKEAQK